MTVQRHITPEAELEAAIARFLPIAFPMLVGKIQHQLRFEVRLGHSTLQSDATSSWDKAGKADILLSTDEKPLAILELKREDKQLTDADRDQAISYARQLTPQPPLAITSNGSEVRFFKTATGEIWDESDLSSETVRRLFENASKLATENMGWAIETLLGPSAGIWVNALRKESRAAIESLTTEIGTSDRPFVRGFSIPRKVTQEALALLDEGKVMIHLSGAPLSGKSNVLREICDLTALDNKYACLFIAGGSGGPGLFRRVANILSGALEWPVSVEEIRQWLRRMAAASTGTSLVVLVDGVVGGSPLADDIEELASSRYGQGLRIVVATDNAASHLKATNGRTLTSVANYTTELFLSGLGEDEFLNAMKVFNDVAVYFEPGAHFCAEYRVPWVLREILTAIANEDQYPRQAAIWPSVMGIEVFDFWRKALTADPPMARAYREFAKAYVNDDAPDSISDRLSSLNIFAVRADAVGATGVALEQSLIQNGWMRQYRSNDGHDFFVPTSPELFLCEVASELAVWFRVRLQDGQVEALKELMGKVGRGPFGELLGATVIFELAKNTQDLSLSLLIAMLQSSPTYEEFREGRFIQRINGMDIGFQIHSDGSMYRVGESGERIGKIFEIDEFPALIGDFTPWMVLSHLARFPFETSWEEGLRLDHLILFEVGKHPYPLISPAGDTRSFDSVELEGMQLVHIDNGIIEPVTASMYHLFLNEGADLDAWFEDVVELGSVPLLHRVMVALQSIAASGLKEGEWASAKLRNVIVPPLATLCPELEIRIADGPHINTVREERRP